MAVIVNDILLDDDFDLLIKNGDLVIGDADEQHLQLIVLLEPGQIRYSPLTGIGISKKLLSPLTLSKQDQIRREAYLQLELDGYQPGASTVEFGEEIIIKADR